MNIIVFKDASGHDKAGIFETPAAMQEWAEQNRDINFRAFQAQEMEVSKAIQFKLKTSTR